MVSDFITFCQQPLHAGRKDRGFALLGVVALDHTHTAQRLRQPPGDLGIDLAALAKNGANLLERVLQHENKCAN